MAILSDNHKANTGITNMHFLTKSNWMITFICMHFCILSPRSFYLFFASFNMLISVYILISWQLNLSLCGVFFFDDENNSVWLSWYKIFFSKEILVPMLLLSCNNNGCQTFHRMWISTFLNIKVFFSVIYKYLRQDHVELYRRRNIMRVLYYLKDPKCEVL